MALRHPQPEWRDDCFGEDESKVPRRLAPPAVVEFQRGGGVREIVGALEAGHVNLSIEAPVGAKKSVDMPSMLLKGGHVKCGLMVHTMPNRNVLAGLADYVRSQHPQVQVTHVENSSQGMPDSGLVCMSTSLYLHMVCQWRTTGQGKAHVLYQDEAHESDYASICMRQLKLNLPYIQVYMSATGTAGGEGFRAPDLPAKCTPKTFPHVDVQQWDVTEPGKPWSADELKGDVLVFCDRPVDRKHLARQYEDAGVGVHALTADSTVPEYKEALSSMVSKPRNSGIDCLLLDSSYRSGGTFPTVTRIIDTAQVAYVDMTTPKTWEVKYRRAHLSEIVQACGRGGRVAGVECEYYRPSYEAQPIAVLGEGAECDFVPVVYRALGFRPPNQYMGTPYATGNLPMNYGKIIQGHEPIRVYQGMRMDHWPGKDLAPGPRPDPDLLHAHLRDDGRLSPAPDAVTLASDDSYGSHLDQGAFEQALNNRAMGAMQEPPNASRSRPKEVNPLGDFNSLLSQVNRLGVDQTVEISLGRYYYVPGVEPVDGGTSIYPGGFSDVQRLWSNPNALALLPSADPRIRAQVLAVSLAAFNDCSVNLNATGAVLKSVVGVIKDMSVPADVVHKWSGMVSTIHQTSLAMASAAKLILGALAGRSIQYADPYRAREAETAAKLMNDLLLAFSRVVADDGSRDLYAGVMSAKAPDLSYREHGLLAWDGADDGSSMTRDLSGRYIMDVPTGSVVQRMLARVTGAKQITGNVAFNG